MKQIMIAEDESVFTSKFIILLKMANIMRKVNYFNTSEDLLKTYRNRITEDPDSKSNIIIFSDIGLKNSTINGVETIDYINNDLGNNVLIGIVSTANGSDLYTGSSPRYEGMTQLEAAKFAGAHFWMVKGGIELKERLIEFKGDFLNGNTRPDFKLYN